MAEESKQFWENIWSQSAYHKKDAKWSQDLRSEVNVKKQEKIDVTTGILILHTRYFIGCQIGSHQVQT